MGAPLGHVISTGWGRWMGMEGVCVCALAGKTKMIHDVRDLFELETIGWCHLKVF